MTATIGNQYGQIATVTSNHPRHDRAKSGSFAERIDALLGCSRLHWQVHRRSRLPRSTRPSVPDQIVELLDFIADSTEPEAKSLSRYTAFTHAQIRNDPSSEFCWMRTFRPNCGSVYARTGHLAITDTVSGMARQEEWRTHRIGRGLMVSMFFVTRDRNLRISAEPEQAERWLS